MPVDYDLVILGGSDAARYAAAIASHLKARVALVEPEPESRTGLSSPYPYGLLHLGQMAQQGSQFQQRDIGAADQSASPRSGSTPSTALADAFRWTRAVADLQTESRGRSLSTLAAAGVDVIQAEAAFQSEPFCLQAEERQLRSRAYLIATGSYSRLPAIGGLETVPVLTVDALADPKALPPCPAHIVILGGEPAGVEIAQLLNRLGYQVTLVVAASQILPQEDTEAAFLVQAYLEAEGVLVLTETAVTQVKQLDAKTWVQAGYQALEADALLVVGAPQPATKKLNLTAVGLNPTQLGLQVNRKLQTRNPRIYACGAVLGGYPLPHIAQYEANLAVHNALLLPTRTVDYRAIPYTVQTDPLLARVGLTERQAQRFYGNQIIVMQHPFKAIAPAHPQDLTPGFVKLVTLRNGKILGAHCVGAETSELIGSLAIAIHQQLKVGAIAHLPTLTATHADVLQQLAWNWERRGDRATSRQGFLESWFNFRRSWNQ